MESIVIGLATYEFLFFRSVLPLLLYLNQVSPEPLLVLESNFPIGMPMFRGENSRTLFGLVLIIIFGGYQLVSSLPTSHRRFSCLFLATNGEGKRSPLLRFEQMCSTSRRRPSLSWPLQLWYSCEFRLSIKANVCYLLCGYVQGLPAPHERRSPAHADSRGDDPHRRIWVVLAG